MPSNQKVRGANKGSGTAAQGPGSSSSRPTPCIRSEAPSSAAAAAAATADHQQQPTPRQRIAAVTPFWQQLPQQRRLELLSARLPELRQQVAAKVAAELAFSGAGAGKATEPQHMFGYEEIWQGQLTNALKDLQQRGSLNAWQLPEGPLFTSAAAFRSFLLQQCIPPDLQLLLPGHSTQPAAAAAAAFQKRMQQLLETLGAGRAKAAALWSWEGSKSAAMQQLGWAGAELQEQMRDAKLALACDVLEALQQEQQQLLQAILQQIEAYVCSLHGAAAEDEQFCLENLCELGAP